MKGIVQSPLQLSTFFLAWVESALIASLWSRAEGAERLAIVAGILTIALLTAGTVSYVLVRLSRTSPALLHDISRWGDAAQEQALVEYGKSGVELRLTTSQPGTIPLDDLGVKLQARGATGT